VAALAGSISQASAQLTVIETPDGMHPGSVVGVANGGSTSLASLLARLDPIEIGAAWTATAGWRILERSGDRTVGRALSSAGTAVLYSDIGGPGLMLERNGSSAAIAPAHPNAGGAALTRDGSTVLFATGSPGRGPHHPALA
jgi:hypothetical protein